MATTFEPVEPYAVDDGDALTIGRLRHAAGRGDARAKLTIRGVDQRQREAREAAQQEHANTGAVARGRDAYQATRDDRGSKRETGSVHR